MDLKQTAGQLIPELAGYQQRWLAAGVIGGLVSLVGLFTNPTQFYQSYLTAYMFCLAVTLGSLALAMVHQLSGGAWGVAIRRPLGAASRVLPVMTLLFIPIIVGMPHLYEWTHADIVARDEVLQHKQLYLNTSFFVVRAAVYFALWNTLTFLLNKWGLEQDAADDPRIYRRMQLLSAGGLVLYVLTITFASFDWLMSLEPHWFSTIYGVLILGGQGLSTLAFVLIVMAFLGRREPLNRILVATHYHDVANLMLAFVMLWAYFSFSQYLIIWAGNLPEEIAWYMHRLHTGWRFVGLALVLFHFALPFVLLLMRAIKRAPSAIAKVAGLVLLARLVDLFWLTSPEFHKDGLAVSWMDVVLPLSMFSIFVGCFIWQLRARPLLPLRDPQFEEALGDLVRGAGRPTTAH